VCHLQRIYFDAIDSPIPHFNPGHECEQVDDFEFDYETHPAELYYVKSPVELHGLEPCEFHKIYTASQLIAEYCPKNHQIMWAFASALAKIHQFDKAIALYDSALALQPDYDKICLSKALMLSNWAYTLLEQRRDHEAQAKFTEALELLRVIHSHEDEVLGMKGSDDIIATVLVLQQYGLQINCHNFAFETLVNFVKWDRRSQTCDPKYRGWAMHNKGRALIPLERYEEAIACYQEALAQEQDSCELRWDMAIAYMLLHDYQQAAACLESATRIKSDDAKAWVGLGFAYHCCEQSELADICRRTSVQLEPQIATEISNLAYCSQVSAPERAFLYLCYLCWLIPSSDSIDLWDQYWVHTCWYVREDRKVAHQTENCYVRSSC
jgi:Flp pilus assembly protein TadD